MVLTLNSRQGVASLRQYNVIAYGARGDGTTDDTLAIRAAITAAGANGVVYFPPGLTFLLSGSLTPLAGQTWWMYGATLKRCNALSTTTTDAIANGAGPTTITVADATGFTVGMDVSLVNGVKYNPKNLRITAIAGNVLTLSGTVAVVSTADGSSQTLSAGGTVYTSFSQIDACRGNFQGVNVTDVHILGGTFNGNQTNNAVFQHWENHIEVLLAGDRSAVRDCYIHDAQSEGIMAGGYGLDIAQNTIISSQGNGIHIGAITAAGTNQARIRHNMIQHCNLSGTATGHADGCIVLSNVCADTLIEGNYCEDGISGIASVDSNDNSSVIITGNIIRSCTASAIDMLTSTDYVQEIIITGNLIYNSVKVYLYSGGSPAAGVGPRRIVISGNYFEQTWLHCYKTYDGVISNNTLYLVGDTTNAAINVGYSAGWSITGNSAVGGKWGVLVAGDSTVRDIAVVGNRCTNQSGMGVALYDASMVNCHANANVIGVESTFTPGAGYEGIRLNNQGTAQGNSITIGPNTSGFYGIRCGAGGTNTAGSIVANNVIRSGSNVPSVLCPSSSQNNIVVNNFIQQAVSNPSPGAQPNTVSGNLTIL